MRETSMELVRIRNRSVLAIIFLAFHALIAGWVEAQVEAGQAPVNPSTDAEAREQMGQTLLRARRYAEARDAFQQVLRIKGKDVAAELGLAQACAHLADYSEALRYYDKVLAAQPEHYDALQGKAFVLYWQHQLKEAKAIFLELARREPRDAENRKALEGIARAEDEERWRALRPGADAPPEERVVYFTRRVAAYPHDLEALQGLARAQTQLGHYPEAVEVYKSVLKMNPDDARTLEDLAEVYSRNGQQQDALSLYRKLASSHPGESRYLLDLARLELRLKDYPAARAHLNQVLSREPRNTEARLQLAQAELYQDQYRPALEHFKAVLKQDPNNLGALFGEARIAFYRGDLSGSRRMVQSLLERQPDNFDALLLLARIEYARHDKRACLQMLSKADQLAPQNREVQTLKQSVRDQPSWTLHTSASYAREIGKASPTGGPVSAGSEDLRNFGYGTTLGFFLLPRTDSYLSLNYLPSEIPSGGLAGSTAPLEFLYRQSTRLTPRLTLRAGAGVNRFGPGVATAIPTQSALIESATSRPLALAGASYSRSSRLSFDLDASRLAVNYTPTAVRLGVMETRLTARVNMLFNSRTELHLESFYGRYATARYEHVAIVNGTTRVAMNQADKDDRIGASIDFRRSLIRSRRFSLEGGYAGLAYGRAGNSVNTYMGFFNPDFYQRHQLVARLYGDWTRAWGYEFAGGFGLQQIGQGQALTRALDLSPSLTRRIGEHLVLGVGYAHYTYAQTLGYVTGNGVRFTTDWKF